MSQPTSTKTAANQLAKVSSAFVFEGRIVKAGDKITLKQSDFKLLNHRGKVVAIETNTTKKRAAAKPDDSKSESEDASTEAKPDDSKSESEDAST
jgi:hypothetical protein